MSNTKILDLVIKKSLEKKCDNREDFAKIKNEVYKIYKIKKPFASTQFIERYNKLVKEWLVEDSNTFRKVIRKRWVRSMSWVTVISLLTKFFGCPWKCVYCPTFEWLPKSYIPNEPAVQRAELNQFDPILQIHNRLRSLEATGHKIEKNDIRIIWGTWSVYPKSYRDSFIKWIYDAFNSYDEMSEHIESIDFSRDKFATFKIKKWYEQKKANSIKEAKKINESSRLRVIWMAIETRPDWVTLEELKSFREYWITRVEIWYQTTFNEINELNKRWHWNFDSIKATRILKNAWFKVVAHMMPNLIWSNPEMDKESLKRVFDDSNFRPDELKIYPMVVTDKSELTDIWKDWWFEPYDDETLINLTAELEMMVPEYIRLNRTYRDIPASEIIAWSHLSNLRQLVEQEVERRWWILKDIRHREIRWKWNNPKSAVLNDFKYEASWWVEHFLTFEDPIDKTIFSLLRLRLPNLEDSKNDWIFDILPELEWAALIREIHTFWDQLSIWEAWTTFGQHLWFWKRLIAKSEELASNAWYKKMAVIAWVWVRAYYEKRWYHLEWEYMVKQL